MPGIPLVTRESSSCNTSRDQMCQEDACQHLSAEEEMEAEESLSLYCKPVELYNILQRRAIRNPLFLQRCLHYKIQAKNKRRIQMALSLSETLNGDLQSHNIFPLYILLGRLVPDIGVAEYSAVYRFTRACVITNFAGVGGSNQTQANFVLPEINKLVLEAKSGSLTILLVSYAGAQISASGVDVTKGHLEKVGGCCLFGKVQLEALCASLEKSPNLILGQRVEMISPVDMNTCFLKLISFKEEEYVSIQMPNTSETVNASKRVHLYVTAEEIGAKEKSPYSSYTFNDIRSASSTHLIRLRAGNIIFNYKYYNNKLQKTEVTEDFSCPFCLVKCASFKGLRYHLPSSHDLFNYEFWVNEEFQAVNISLKADIWRPEIVAGGVDPKQQTFFFCSKKSRVRRLKNLARRKHMHPLISQSNTQVGACEFLDKADGGNNLANASSGTGECAEHWSSGFDIAGLSASPAYPDADCGQSSSANNLLQFAKTRKLSVEQSENRSRSLLHKRQFFHSHRAQSMAIQQVLSDRDSEDEVDDDVADFEDRRLLDDFVDVTKDEKQIMHFWNSFVRKQRVLADSHIPWACEAFTKLHAPDLNRAPSLAWCWRLLMIKLWNHGLLDARTMNRCNIILEQLQKQDVDVVKG